MLSFIKRPGVKAALVVVAAIGFGSLWLVIPSPAGLEGGISYSPVGAPVTLMDTIIAIGGAWLFFLGLRGFKPELKPAYRLIAFAQLSIGLLTLLFPFIEYFDLWGNVWFNMSSYLAYLVGSIFMYFGARLFLKISGKRSRAASLLVLGLVLAVVWGMHFFIPHADSWPDLTELQYDLFRIIPIIPIVCFGFAAYMILVIKRTIGRDYQKAFAWLAAGIGLQTLAAITIGVLEIIGYENWYFSSRAYEIPVIVADLAILGAAMQFNSIGHVRPLNKKAQEAMTSVDIILYVTNLAADPSKIDPYLDRMRLVTARMEPGVPLSASDQMTLRDVYLDIEQYLTESDSLRTFTKESLRKEIAARFALDTNADKTFWPLLQTAQPAAAPTVPTLNKLI